MAVIKDEIRIAEIATKGISFIFATLNYTNVFYIANINK
jgi:hypothetical protein